MNKKLYDLMDWEQIETIVYSEHDHPEEVLGIHKVKAGALVQVFLPGAKNVFAKGKKDGKIYHMEQADEDGFFAVLMPARKRQPYELIAEYENGVEEKSQDPYLYGPLIPKEQLQAFGEGKNSKIYQYLGAHYVKVTGYGEDAKVQWDVGTQDKKDKDSVYGTHFAVWAPNAMRVSVVGDFNQWDGRKHPMCRLGESGVFSIFLPDIACGEIYKYEIKRNIREITLKSDPYGFQFESRPANATIVTDLSSYSWRDEKWMAKRKNYDFLHEPMCVYEVDLGTWAEKDLEQGENHYRKMAPKLAEYVLDMGYTHIELLPVTEYLEEDSLGYEPLGYYAPTSRYGTPEDFMYFVDYMHGKNIGVIMDWMGMGFSLGENGLVSFDGTSLYGDGVMIPSSYGNRQVMNFAYDRPQVEAFLISSVLFWKDQYHIDGVKISGLDGILYLDYGKDPEKITLNKLGGNENLAGVEMLRSLTKWFHESNDGAFLIGCDSGAWPMVTEDIEQGGLGFDLKWNNGWNQEFMEYMLMDPLFRKGSHGAVVDSILYYYSEKFVECMSHEWFQKKEGYFMKTFLGDIDHKMGNLRAAYGYLMTYPGKKLLFMGMDYGQEELWDPFHKLNWREQEEEPKSKLHKYVKEWNHFYRKHPALYQSDYDREGFEWISCLDADHSIIAFLRKDSQEKEILLVVCNFTPILYENFKVGVPFGGKYKELFNSEEERFGGTGQVNSRMVTAKKVSWDGRSHSITINLGPFAVTVLRYMNSDKTGKSKK